MSLSPYYVLIFCSNDLLCRTTPARIELAFPPWKSGVLDRLDEGAIFFPTKMGALFIFRLPQKKLCCFLHHILLCSPIPFIIILPLGPWYNGAATNGAFNHIKIHSGKFSAIKQRLLRQSVCIHKLFALSCHLLSCLLYNFINTFMYKKWEVPLSCIKTWRTGTSLWNA